MRLYAFLTFVAIGAAGCGDDVTPALPMDLSAAPSNNDLSAAIAVDMAVSRGPVSIPLHFEPDGLYWDSAKHRLLIANDSGNQIVSWDDSGTIAVAALLPLVNADGGLGQLVTLTDGTILATRFGSGVNGGIVVVAPDGTSSLVPNLDPKRQRVGLAVGSDGTIYETYFAKGAAAGSHIGAIATVTLAGVETDIVTGLQKPVGVLAAGAQLYISDQDQGIVFSTPIATPGTTATFATAAGCDLLTAGPSGALFSGGKTGTVYRYAMDGTVTMVESGDRAIRGVAYDPDGKRLFFAEPDGSSIPDAGDQAALHIIPIDM